MLGNFDVTDLSVSKFILRGFCASIKEHGSAAWQMAIDEARKQENIDIPSYMCVFERMSNKCRIYKLGIREKDDKYNLESKIKKYKELKESEKD